MRVLITNDDGVASEGLWALAKRVVDAGYEAVVAAPTTDMTGMGAAIGGDLHGGELHAQRIVRADLGATPCWAVDGPPALCVNPGVNCGRSALHSGTVGAGLTAANNGAHGIAVSLDVTDAAMEWGTAVHLVPEMIERLRLIEKGRRVVNINAPNISLTEVVGVQITGLAKWGDAAGTLQSSGDGSWSFERQPGDPKRRIAGTDNAAVREGSISVSELVGLKVQTSDLDLTDLAL